jgi:hypothetical protein
MILGEPPGPAQSGDDSNEAQLQTNFTWCVVIEHWALSICYLLLAAAWWTSAADGARFSTILN